MAFLMSWKFLTGAGLALALLGGVWLWHTSAVAQAREAGRKAGYEDGEAAANKAHEDQAEKNRKASAALRRQLVAATAENEKLKREVRDALGDLAGSVVVNARGLCLVARARGYPCEGDPAGVIPGEVRGPSPEPLRDGTDGSGRVDR